MVDQVGNWSLIPVYDIACNSGINGYHQMDVAGEAQHPTTLHLLKFAKLANIKQNKAQAIIEQVTSVAGDFLTVISTVTSRKNDQIMLLTI